MPSLPFPALPRSACHFCSCRINNSCCIETHIMRLPRCPCITLVQQIPRAISQLKRGKPPSFELQQRHDTDAAIASARPGPPSHVRTVVPWTSPLGPVNVAFISLGAANGLPMSVLPQPPTNCGMHKNPPTIMKQTLTMAAPSPACSFLNFVFSTRSSFCPVD